jgi:hypothetical protein
VKKFLLIALVIGAAAAAAIHYYGSPAKPTVAQKLTIHFTCDTSGRLEPCGCFTGQHGGLTRLMSWLEARPERHDTLKFDVGGALAGVNDYDLIQYRYLARAYREMGFAALNMGAAEAAIPAKTLASLPTTSAVPMVSASLVDATTRKEILEPFRIVEAAGKRIGVLGVVSPASVVDPGEGIAVLGLDEAIERQLPALREKADLVVLLAFAKESELRRLARDYYEFSLILGGDVGGPAQDLIRENDSIVLFTTNEARTVGTLTATLDGQPRARLLDPAYEITLLEERIPQHGDLTKLVREFRDEIRSTPLAVDDPNAVDPRAIPGVQPSATYVGSAACQSCHPKAFETWRKSGHGHAFETLVKKGSDADPHCIECHTVGFGRPSGYRRPFGKEKLVDVGCESCHGPASEHVAHFQDGKKTAFKFRPVGPGDCVTCHHGEFSRPFEWEKFWPLIEHGK